METPKSSFYLNFTAVNNSPYHSSNGVFESSTPISPDAYRLPDDKGEIRLEKSALPGGATLQKTVLYNNSQKPLSVDILSSAFLYDIGVGGKKYWDEDRFRVHFAYSVWQGEGQWRHMSIEEAGLYKTYDHQTQSTIRLTSIGTWSSNKYFPVILLEDTELNKTYYAELLVGGRSWQIEVGSRGHRNNSSLCVFLATDCTSLNNWNITPQPDECYTTVPTLYGCVDGGFEEAVAALTLARRALALRAFPDGVPPLCFNDYMNCLWGIPTREKLIPLMDAAAAVGAEYFVIDAGWFKAGDGHSGDMGDWLPNDESFGCDGLQGIIDEIIARGMRPGLWLEIESIASASLFAQAHPEALLYRNGHVIGGTRCFLDYRNSTVRLHIRNVFDRLYKMGVRYIKNDYNQTVGIGIDTPGQPDKNPAEAMSEHSDAVMSLIDEVCELYPDLVIESCCSGAMRADLGAVRHFYLQSASDQEGYLRNPSVVSGLSACLAPERIGVWTCPYPVEIDYRESFTPSPEFTARFADGRVTAYNMVTGLMGLMYLSGHIDCTDELNLTLMKDAATIYKRNRTSLMTSVPIYPMGTLKMSEKKLYTYGLLDSRLGKIYLAVWSTRLPNDNAVNLKVCLSHYAKQLHITDFYPSLPGYSATVSGSELTVCLASDGCAAYIELDIMSGATAED